MSTSGELAVRYQFDREPVWKRIQGREVVSLDSNIWIDMADGKKPDARPIKETLIDLVQAGTLFCPLSPTLIWELYKQDSSLLRTGELMETLSLNVCFASTDEIFDWEVECFAKKLAGSEDDRCTRKMLFVPVMGYLTSRFRLVYPADTPEDTIRDFGKIVQDRLNSLTLTELLKLRGDGISQFLKCMPPTPFQKEALRARESAKGDRSKVWRTEEESVASRYIMPAIRKLPFPLRLYVLQFAKNAPRDKYDGCLPTLLGALSAIHNHVEVMIRALEDPNRKDKSSDFFDLDMLPVPLAYADVFVSQDKWIRDILKNRGSFLKRNPCKFCQDFDELKKWLEGHKERRR
jgi:hypothetical protein